MFVIMPQTHNMDCACAFLGVTGLVTTDHKNARDIDVNLWAMTNHETGEYGVSHTLNLIFHALSQSVMS